MGRPDITPQPARSKIKQGIDRKLETKHKNTRDNLNLSPEVFFKKWNSQKR
jgi:hypothetical protein